MQLRRWTLGALALLALAPAIAAMGAAAAVPSAATAGAPAEATHLGEPGGGGPGDQEAALARGLAAIQPGRIKADLWFLADAALRGRDTPSPEQRVAALFLRARLERLGFEPAGEDGGYFDRYPLEVNKLDAGASSLVLSNDGGSRRLAFGTDYFLGSRTDGAELDTEGGIVFCGEGRRGDFAAAGELEGRWALCFDAGSRGLQRRNLAREHGAIGLFVTPGPSYAKEPYAVRHAAVTAELLRGLATQGRGFDAAAFPEVFLTPDAARDLVPPSGTGELKIGSVLPASAREVRRMVRTALPVNVCGLWPGRDPALRNDVMLVSAHYDHVGARGGAIYQGADDNGSGTSGVLAIAEALAAHGPLKRSVLLIWVSGEEKGLLGSAAWSAEPTLPAGMRAVCDLNIDMIGRNAPDRLGFTPSERHPEANLLGALARELAPLEGFGPLESVDDFYERSDQASFAKLGIPVCFLFAGVHEDYHKPTDTPDKIDYDKVRRVSRLVFRMLLRLDEQTL